MPDFCPKMKAEVEISENGQCSMKQGAGNGKMSNSCPQKGTIGCLLIVELPREVLDAIEYNAKNGKCPQCEAIYPQIVYRAVNIEKLGAQGLLAHLNMIREAIKEQTANSKVK